MKTLTWNQVAAWRLRQHCLSQRLPPEEMVSAVLRTGGIQAQVLSAAELAISARVDGLKRQDIQVALWQARILIKTWAMRGTLYLIAADEMPLYIAARTLHHDPRGWDKYFAYYGVTPTQQAEFLAAVPEVLAKEPLTREQLATAVSERAKAPHLRDLIISSGWGSPLKLSAFRGELCFGPSQGQNVTFVNPRTWIGKWQDIDPAQAFEEIILRYLRTYGPATPEDFSWWWFGGGVGIARKMFKALAGRLEPVDVEGWQAFALPETVEQMAQMEGSSEVFLLPMFDAYTLALSKTNEPILPSAYKKLVYRMQGWITAVVLVGGYVKGVWEHRTKRAETVSFVRMFATPTKQIQRRIKAETERMGSFLNTKMLVTYE